MHRTREKNAKSKCVISMDGNTTTITNPENGDVKSFSFDHCYWSHDECTEDENGVFTQDSQTSKYADQNLVFKDLGQGVLDNAWQGYNATLFAYGQTGSGKSYSMTGYGANKGIVPITCGELFNAIEKNKDDNKQLRVTFSMLEIYNEQIRDLLVKGQQKQGGLKVRQSPKIGFYVEGLKQVPVSNYREIEQLMEQGAISRTTASTNMNATSSRSHMVITIKFEQVFMNTSGQSTTKSSEINLVDLAGSERANSTGATGDRLKEGAAINQSLSTLGNVISALADIAGGKKKVLIPYRDSVLTKLSQSALGGNSRTIMIAALSPAGINFDETLSTLRYADRAKKIQNNAVINESPTERLIRELKEENDRLLEMLKSHGKKGNNSEELKYLLAENERQMGNQLSWEQRLEEARSEWEKTFLNTSKEKADWEQLPYIMNINEDSQLNGVIKHCFDKGKTVIGKENQDGVNVAIKGFSIQAEHAVVYNDGSKIYIEPSTTQSLINCNGARIKTKTQLHHLDRLKFGTTSLFLFMSFTSERGPQDQIDKYNYDYFMTEIAEHEGLAAELQTPRTHGDEAQSSTTTVFHEFVDLMPLITEANAISEELNKHVKFEAEVKSSASHETTAKSKDKEVLVKVTNTLTRKVWIWSKGKFINRKNIMDQMYSEWSDSGQVKVSKKNDPFWDPVEDVFLGSCHVWLQPVAYRVEVDEHFAVHNYHGKEEAVIHVQIVPCNERGKPKIEDDILVDSDELLGCPLHFHIKLPQCMGVRWVMEDNSRGVYCRVVLPDEKHQIVTDRIWNKIHSELAFSRQISYKKVSAKILQNLLTQSLVLELWGTQDKTEVEHTEEHVSRHLDVDIISPTNGAPDYSSLQKENKQLKEELEKSRKTAHHQNGTTNGLDVDLAKNIQIFFKDIRSVQHQIQSMKDIADGVQKDGKYNGNMKVIIEDYVTSLDTTDKQLSTCVQALRKSVMDTIKKNKSK
ncbi:kinesin-like protein KIF28P [Patella vulgata]|uniref:kinesin-like protein KIF28P n=1 Tax=Patella vulgata TaxID=6465 RepID=UPI00217FFFBD|nr:kinesin-like protein KIF28P [Patella vulgata]